MSINIPGSLGGWGTFAHVAGQSASGGVSGSYAATVVLPNNPTPGNTVCVAAMTFNNDVSTAPTVTIRDSNSNAYTVSPSSPVSGVPVGYIGFLFLAYLLVAPANASKTITATFSMATGGYAGIFADEFAPTGGTPVFDSDAAATGTGSSAHSPSVPVAGSTELLYSGVMIGNYSPTANSPWTANTAGAIFDSWLAAFDVSASSNTLISSTTVSDFTTTSVAAGDVLGFYLTSVSRAKQVSFQLLVQ